MCPGSCYAAALRSGQGIPLGSHPQRASAGRAGDSRCADDACWRQTASAAHPKGRAASPPTSAEASPGPGGGVAIARPHPALPTRGTGERRGKPPRIEGALRVCAGGVRVRVPRGARAPFDRAPSAGPGSPPSPSRNAGPSPDPHARRRAPPCREARGPRQGGVQANLQGPDAPLRHLQPPNSIPGRGRGPRARPTPREERKGHTDAVRCAGSEESHRTVAVPSESGIRRPAPRRVRAEAQDPAGSEVARRGRWEPEGPHPPSERCPPRPDHDQRPITCPEADAPSLERSGPRAADLPWDRRRRRPPRAHRPKPGAGGVRRGGPRTDEAQPTRGSVAARPSCEVTPRRGAGGRSRSRFEGAASGLDRGRGRGDRRRDRRPKPKVHGATAVADAEGRCAGPKTRPDCSGRARPQARAASRPATMRAFA